jgi:uncharacterized repeat protein (TIGR01451 family)
MRGLMACRVIAAGVLGLGLVVPASAQMPVAPTQTPSPSVPVAGIAAARASASASAPAHAKAAASRPAARLPSPFQSRLGAQKVVLDKDGKESLEDAANVTVGDTVQYGMQHRNVSQRTFLNVDFGIPIPPGTSYVEGSATPEGARRVRLDSKRDQYVWRVEKILPGEQVSMSLRVKIDPDPMLTPTLPEPRKLEFKRQ